VSRTERPSTAAEVADLLKACSESATPVIAVGGGTGLADATEPSEGELVLLTERLDLLEPVDVAASQVTVGAGVTLAELERHVRSAGFEFPLDLGARASARMGGIAASNAGGSLAWRFGSMRELTAGVEAVLADGSIVGSVRGLRKDNAGYDLRGLLVGSEGTLGVITKLRLKLVPSMPARATALIAAPSPDGAIEIAVHLRRSCPDLIVCDFIGARAADLSCERLGVKSPVELEAGGWLVLAELGSSGDERLNHQRAEALPGLEAGAPETAIAVDAAQRDAIWKIRDSIYEACEATGPTRKLDLSVQVGDLPELEEGVLNALAAADCDPSIEIATWGHLLDGNFHATLMGTAATPEVELATTRQVQPLGGSVAAEHGVGRRRLGMIEMTRSKEDLAAMSLIRRALDPAGILAPGRALPDRD
jgi:FAD/FMN-containing dehydrogenase